MMIYVKRATCFFVFLCSAILLSGCKLSFIGYTQINRVEFIRAVGVDKSADGENIHLTIANQRVMTSGGGGGSEQKQSDILFSEGETLFEALRNFWSFMDRRPFMGHLEYVLIGEEAAKEGILNYLDLFTRDPEIRLSLNVFIVKGTNASEIIKLGNTSGKFVFDRLQGIQENKWGMSLINNVDLMETMYILDTEYLSLYIPCVKLSKHSEGVAELESKEMDISLEGFAIFDRDKLAAFLEKDMARGLNWLKNKVESGVVVIKSPKGKKVSLEIIESNRRIKPAMDNGELNIRVEIEVRSHVAEIQSEEDIFKAEIIDYLEEQQERIIKDEVGNVIKFAQERGLDCFGIGDAVFYKYPNEWEDLYEKNWRDVFSKIEFDIVVNSQITRTYDIKQPVGNRAGDSG